MKILSTAPLATTLIAGLMAVAAMNASAQNPPAAPSAAAATAAAAPVKPAGPPQFNSPEVAPDGRLTIRVYQPRAATVTLQGEWDGARTPMTRDEQGLWSFSTAPLAPGIYEYSVMVDDLPTLDFKNPNVKGGTHNLVEVPGAGPQWHDAQAGPQGTVHIHRYASKATGTTRRVHVYTPPGYEASAQTYPVLYLLHGSGDDDSGWTSFFGRADIILDNLIAAREAVPMIVVMPLGHVNVPGRELNRSEVFEVFENDLLRDVLPLVEKSYRVKTDRRNRALAGLSMGGGQTAVIGLKHPEKFSAYGIFSAGIWPQTPAPFETAIDTFKQSPLPNDVLWIGIGKRDFVYDRAQVLLAKLREKNVRFTYYEDNSTHSWPTWRDFLHRFAPLLFKAKP